MSMYYPCFLSIFKQPFCRIHQKIWLGLLFICWFTISNAADLAKQRQQFLLARTALQENKIEQYTALEQQLVDYPLYPYLVYAVLSKRLANTDEQTVQQFLTQYADTPLAAKLRHQWIYVLAQREQWDRILDYYEVTPNVELQCLHRQALLTTAQTAAAFDQIQKLWLTGRSLPLACNRLFTEWQQQVKLPKQLIWQRLSLAIQAKNDALVMYLSGLLPKTDSTLISTWQKLYKDPALLNKPNILKIASPLSLFITAHSLQRLAEKEPLQAIALWKDQFKTYPFTHQQRGFIIRRIALSLANQGLPEAAEWLSHIPDKLKDANSREWQIRIALSTEDWQQILLRLRQLPAEERNIPQWQYWLARANAAIGKDALAMPIYQQLSKKNHYYGLLANTQLGKAISFTTLPPHLGQQQLIAVEQLPAIQRAQELYQLGLLPEAREEWQFSLRYLKPMERYAAAYLANQWGWYERTISTLAQTPYRDDLSLRFPMAYREQVLLQAQTYNLDPAWIFAVIRQESAFMADARSHVGALGLMQLMPGTADFIAQRLRQKLSHRYEVLEISLNLRFGSYYLKHLFDIYQGNIILATAAYNAGPGRVRKWLMQRPPLTSDIWVETIPWKETRNYVKNILAFRTIYQFHLGEKPNLQAMRESITHANGAKSNMK